MVRVTIPPSFHQALDPYCRRHPRRVWADPVQHHLWLEVDFRARTSWYDVLKWIPLALSDAFPAYHGWTWSFGQPPAIHGTFRLH
ncbi:hypothetical protein TPY_1464 [Sulfobacillus acidophilus TPY]|uniref:Uncharacterized protein n=1 Tax=Sulfobacillus acidophilus (strain ATCC 700253 / DSM 10332 / NAL) TaxID=679936 RepID=G8U0H5_SULAD|nr:hypothetical protein TPY_1464 [Sulfobacillus acidophilus TPY]AEW04197.1 hypothetical protein Sulac_0689 [Sulfobacillus acidophilus DSM 10332]